MFTVPNACALNNKCGCSGQCLLSSVSGCECICPTGSALLNDSKSCSDAFRKMLVFSQRSEMRLMSVEMPYWADVLVATPQHLENIVALHVDTIEGKRSFISTVFFLYIHSNIFFYLSCGENTFIKVSSD